MNVTALAAEAVAWRRHLHANPELSFHEHNTARFVRETLESFGGLELEQPTPTSVVARLQANAPDARWHSGPTSTPCRSRRERRRVHVEAPTA